MAVLIINPDEAIIGPDDTIGLTLTAVDKTTGKPIPGAQISNVQFNQDNQIGQITPTSAPNQYLFTPAKIGVVNLEAMAEITLP